MVSRRLILVFGCSMLASAVPLAPALAASDATAAVTDFGNQALQMLNDPQLSQAEREKRFGALLDRDFDFVKTSRFVLGAYWQSATEQEKQQFAPSFRNYVVKTYATRFGEFTGASFTITGERPEGAGSVIVNSTVMQRNNQSPAKVDWRVSTETSAPKITDVIVNDVSMSLTYRHYFTAMIKRDGHGVAGLIAQLRSSDGADKQ